MTLLQAELGLNHFPAPRGDIRMLGEEVEYGDPSGLWFVSIRDVFEPGFPAVCGSFPLVVHWYFDLYARCIVVFEIGHQGVPPDVFSKCTM